ncbi:MAG: ECF transporter S component [Clostridiales bacterium]|nr:ECF transporter S component [Clostridiales bacterium]
MNRKYSSKTIAKIGLMTAISCVLLLIIRIPFPPAPFLRYDPADVPIFVTAFAFGPIPGIIVTIVVSLIQAFALGEDGVYGFIMHVIATGSFVVVASTFYSVKKSKKRAMEGIVAGVVVMTIIMCLANMVITPLFMGIPKSAVMPMILPVVLPFNLLKAGINGAITMIIYKRISTFLHKN